MSQTAKQKRIDYNVYIKSHNWYSKHPGWLKAVGYRCTMFPWVRIGRGQRYACHHMHYKNLGDEKLKRDVVPLSPFAHDFIVHGILSGFKSAGQQRNYPNFAQQLVHFWCVQGLWVKRALALLILWKLAEAYLNSK